MKLWRVLGIKYVEGNWLLRISVNVMKTTNRIALYFTLFSSLLLLIFWLALNFFLVTQSISDEYTELKKVAALWISRDPQRGPAFIERQRFMAEYTNTITLPGNDPEVKALFKDKKNTWNLSKWIISYDGFTFLYLKDWWIIHFRDVTDLYHRRKDFLFWTWVSLLIFALLSFVFWKWFTHYALRDLDTLASFVEKLDVHTLTREADFSHLPDDDKIKIVSNSIQNMQLTIKTDVDRIKHFVANVSHEFKTPFMMMQSSSELALATKDYKTWLEKNIGDIERLNTLLDSLLELTHAQKFETFDRSQVLLSPILQNIIWELWHLYDKNIHITNNISDTQEVLWHEASLVIILKNIIENAYKYSPDGSTISITVDDNKLSITNTGTTLSSEQLTQMREPFWQVDSSKEKDAWFGLGLALVKELIQKNNRKIWAESKNNETTFEIDMN